MPKKGRKRKRSGEGYNADPRTHTSTKNNKKQTRTAGKANRRKTKQCGTRTELWSVDAVNKVANDPASTDREIRHACDVVRSREITSDGKFYSNEVKYTQNNRIGRKYASSPSFQGASRHLRGLAANGHYHDLDLKNAHPTILVSLAKQYGLDAPNLKDYFKDRGAYIAQAAEDTGMEPGKLKKDVFLKTVNFGRAEGVSDGTKTSMFLCGLRSDIWKIFNTLRDLAEYGDIKDLARESKHKKKCWSFQGSFISRVCQHHESEIIDAAVAYVEETKNCWVDSLVFDGFMVRDSDREGNKVDISDAFLKGMAAHCKEKTGFDVEFTEKPLGLLLDGSEEEKAGLDNDATVDHETPVHVEEQEEYTDRYIVPQFFGGSVSVVGREDMAFRYKDAPSRGRRLHPFDFKGNRFLLINAAMGTGKTTTCLEYMRNNQEELAILCITARKQQCTSLAAKFKPIGFESYDNETFKKTRINSNPPPVWQAGRLVIQYESLHKLLHGRPKSVGSNLGYDLVILDEVRSVLGQSVSVDTNKDNIRCNANILEGLLRHPCHAKRVLMMDADLETDSMVAGVLMEVKHTGTPPGQKLIPDYIDNELTVVRYPNGVIRRGIGLVRNEKAFMGLLKQDIKEGKKVGVAFRTKKDLDAFKESVPAPEGREFVFVDRDTSRDVMDEFKHLDTFLGNDGVQAFLFTSKLTTAADITTQFDRLYVLER